VTSTGNAIAVFSPGTGVVLTIGTGVELVNLYTLAGSDNINLDLTVAGLQKSVDAGAGDDIVDLSGTTDATMIGGAGDDFLTGTLTLTSLTAARAMTSSSAWLGKTICTAAKAMICSSAAAAMTTCSARRGRTRWCGIRATAMTCSREARARTSCSSSAAQVATPLP
jgi:hypothetical protein